MAYIGLEPSNSFVSLKRQVITGNGGASYTLDHSVASVNDVAIFVNNVRQDPAGYSISGAALTLGGTIESSDDCYVIFLGQALQTVTPDSDTITTAMLKSNAVTSAKLTYPLTTFSSTGIDDNADATAMTITSAEKIGIGETVPLGQLHVKSGDSGVSSPDITDLVVECSGSGGMSLLGATNGQVEIAFGDSGDANIGRIGYNHDSNFLAIVVNALERMRIDSSGNVLIGLTSLPTSNQGGIAFEKDGIISTSRSSDATLTHHSFKNTNGTVGSIKTSGSSTSFNTSSDYRLKENVVDITNATDRLKQLQPKRFNFIADADTTVDGFIAHEVSSVVPEAITGTKDEVDEDGNPVYQGIDQSKLVPLLVKTIQELEARIKTLEDA